MKGVLRQRRRKKPLVKFLFLLAVQLHGEVVEALPAAPQSRKERDVDEPGGPSGAEVDGPEGVAKPESPSHGGIVKVSKIVGKCIFLRQILIAFTTCDLTSTYYAL